jgi:RNA polymerase sigma factor (sigma-70 family)
MAQRPWNPILQHIRSLAARHDSPSPDAELLSQFISHNDEAAFESLLRRHGPMVLRVARRTVGNETDAEDVFQATFLLLARRAGAIRKRESVASWLHGVAHRLALSARSKYARRQVREREAAAARSVESSPDSAWSELEETLHEVLAQLPAKYRTPLVHCYLEGWTQEEVARQLGKPLGTVRSWLARGRELLRKRLVRRGISLSTEGASAALLASACATAEAVPPTLRMATLKAAQLFAGGGNAMTLISPAVADLVKKGMTAMLFAKLKNGAAWVVTLTLLVAGSGWAAYQTLKAKPSEANETAEKAQTQQAAAEERPRTDDFDDPLPPGAVARLGTVRFRHEGSDQFALSPDGRTLAAAAGRSLIFWDMATGRPLRRFPFDPFLHCLAFAPDGKSVAIGGEDCIIHRIDSSSGKEFQRFAGHREANDQHGIYRGIRGVAFTSDGSKLISWGSDNTVRVWEAKSGKELRQLGPHELGEKNWYISGLSPDGKLLAVSKNEPQHTPLHLWKLETGKEIPQRTYPNASGGVAFSPNSKILAISEASQVRPGRIVLWDVESGKELAASPSQKGWVEGMAFSADGKTLASAGFGLTRLGSRIHLWDVASMKELRVTPTLPSPFSSSFQLAFSPDGRTLVSRGHEAHVRLFDVASGQERTLPEGPPRAIHSLAWSPDAKLVTSIFGNKIWFWSATTGKLVRKIECPWHYVSAAAFSADGKSFVSVSGNGTVCLWDTVTGKEQRRMETLKGQFILAGLSPSGETIALWGHETPQAIFLWNIHTGKKRGEINVLPEEPGVRQSLYAILFSTDGKSLYACSGTHLNILRWDVASGKELRSFGKHNGGVNGIALSPDGRSIAALSLGGSLYVWETATGQARLLAKDVGFATSISFSPDGRLLALTNSGNSRLITGPNHKTVVQGVENREQVRLVRIADGKVIRRFTGHLGGIDCVSFSPDGRMLASGGQDTTVLLWDVTNRAVSSERRTTPLTPEKLGELWKGLLGTAEEAHGSMWPLIETPGETVRFLGEKLKPIAVLDAERFARLLKMLESDQFAEREEATQELKKLGASIEPALRKAIQEKVTLETRRRMQGLLDDLEGAERLRSLRAIEVLERIGDEPSRDLLRRLAGGAAGAWLTEEARISLHRSNSAINDFPSLKR